MTGPDADLDAVEVFFDYTCPFTYRAHRWLETLDDLSVTWRPFSLLEHNYDLDLDHYRRQVLRAWHQTRTPLDLDAIMRIAADAGVHADPAAVRAHFLDAEADYAAAAALGVFGTPSLAYPDQTVAFVKLDAIPATYRARTVWETTRRLADETVELREWQRVTPPPR